MSWVHQADEDVILCVKVQPRAARTGVVGILGDTLKIRLQAPPVDGKANKELTGFLAKTLGLPASRIEIRVGDTSRTKRIRVSGYSADVARECLLGNSKP